MGKRNKEELKALQSLPLHHKIALTQARIEEWVEHYGEDGVYVSFSGGKDSTVLLHIVREMYPDIEAVFVNTGLEYPEIQKFVKTFDNVTILRPNIRFDEVIKKYGYPVISKEVSNTIAGARRSIEKGVYSHRLCKLGVSREDYGGLLDDGKYDYDKALERSKFRQHKWKPLLEASFYCSSYCCDEMKKKPAAKYEKKTGKKPMIAELAEESANRENAWFKNGCNGFGAKKPKSTPMAFWTEQDVLQYIKDNNIPIASVYGDIVYAEDPEQVRWSEAVPAMAELDTASQRKLTTTGCKRTGCIFCAFGAHCRGDTRFVDLKETHPRQYEYCIGGGECGEDGVWCPSKDGLGMGHVFDELNKLYGDGFIKY